MKNYIKKQNLLGLLLVFVSVATNNTSNASQNCGPTSTQTNIEKEFDMLINCARFNPNGSWFRTGGWECGKYFLPLSNDKANFEKSIEATDFSEEGQRVANEFTKKHKNMGSYTIYEYIQQKDNPNYKLGEEDNSNYKERKRNKKMLKLAKALQDQNPRTDTLYYHNLFLQYAGQKEFTLDNLFNGAHFTQKFSVTTTHKLLPIIADKQDQKNILQTIARHKFQAQYNHQAQS